MPTTSTLQWPLELQKKPNVEGFQAGGPEGAVQFEPTDGAPKRRPRYSSVPDFYDFQIYVTLDEFDLLMDFYKTSTGNGSLSFAWNDPITDERRDFRFRARPTATAIGGLQLVASISVTSV